MEDPQDRPYIEPPDEHLPEPGRIYCFLDATRPCSSECVAFLPARPEGPDYVEQPWSMCMLLVNVHKLGKHHVAIAQQGASLLKHHKVKSADEARANQVPPPPVK